MYMECAGAQPEHTTQPQTANVSAAQPNAPTVPISTQQCPALYARVLEPASTTPPTTAHAFPISNSSDLTSPTAVAYTARHAAPMAALPAPSRHTASLLNSTPAHARAIWCSQVLVSPVRAQTGSLCMWVSVIYAL
jgi:hypothetical protein